MWSKCFWYRHISMFHFILLQKDTSHFVSDGLSLLCHGVRVIFILRIQFLPIYQTIESTN